MTRTEIIQNITRKSLGLTFVLSAAVLAFAQEREKVDVQGTIVDKNNQPIPYASVSFSSKINKIFSDATLTDENGRYNLQLVPGNYDVTVEAINYKKNATTKQIAGGSIGRISLESEGASAVTPTKNIEGVVITAPTSKPLKVELDKKVYDPSTDLLSKGGTLQDVLTNVPSVAVDPDGTVSMRGNANVRFLINGKPSALLGIDDGTNALQAIPAEQIERIEVITNPSSKFEASGTAGILNIILKKTKGTGFNGTVTGTLGYLPTTNLNTNLSWKKGNWTWFLNGGGGYRESESVNRNNTRYFDPITRQTTRFVNQNGVTTSENNNYNANAGFAVDLTEKTSFNMGGLIRYMENTNLQTIDNRETNPDGSLIRNSQTLAPGTMNSTSYQGDIGIDHKFNNQGHNLSASFSLQRSNSFSENNSVEMAGNTFVFGTRGNNNTINKTMIGKVDYELPIGEASKLEVGYRFDNNINDYDFLNYRDFNGGGNYIAQNLFSGNTVYNEMFNAGYTQFKSKIEKFGYQVGLRVENTNINIDYHNLDGEHNRVVKNYTGFFPSVFLSYDLGSSNSQILVNYSRRINRPRAWFLIPYPTTISNRLNLFRGNADLNPEYVNSYEIGYSLQKRKITLNPTIYLRHTQDETRMVVVSETAGSATLVTRPFNIGQDYNYGIDINATADILPWWKVIGNVDLYGYTSKGNYYDPNLMTSPFSFEGKGFSTRVRLTNNFRIDKTFNIQVQGNYRGPENTASMKRQSVYFASLGANKTIWNGNGTISFNVQDVFVTRARRAINYGNNFEREMYMRWMPRTFNLSLTYRFKQGEKIEQPKRKRDAGGGYSDDDMPPM